MSRDETNFRSEELPARVERQLSYEGLVDYLRDLEGAEVAIRIAVGDASLGGQSGAELAAGERLLTSIGKVGPLRPVEGALDTASSTDGVVVPIGTSTELEIDPASVSGATLLSIGPEARALIIARPPLQLLIQDPLFDL